MQVHEEEVIANLAGFENLAGLKLERRIVLQFSNFFQCLYQGFQ